MTAIYNMYWESIKANTRVFSEQIPTTQVKIKKLAVAELESGVITQKDYDNWLGIGVSS